MYELFLFSLLRILDDNPVKTITVNTFTGLRSLFFLYVPIFFYFQLIESFLTNPQYRPHVTNAGLSCKNYRAYTITCSCTASTSTSLVLSKRNFITQVKFKLIELIPQLVLLKFGGEELQQGEMISG